MKVLHIIDSMGLGGAQTLVKGIFEYQKDSNDIFLFSLRRKNIEIEVNHPNVTIYNSTKKYSLGPLFALRRFIKENRIDILHCHLFKSNIFGYLLKRIWFPNIKLVIHEHGEIFQGHFLYNFSLNFFCGSVFKFLAVSESTLKSLVNNSGIPKDKILIIPNFVNLDQFNSDNINWDILEEKKKIGIVENEYVIGFVGRLDNVKGCEYLIRALPMLNFQYKVLIVGDGKEMESLKSLVRKLNIQNKVKFLGYRNDTVFIYTLLDMLVVPSLFESFGLSVIEAQAMGVPVAVSNVDGLKELVVNQENGIVFEVKNIDSIAKSINIITDVDRIKLFKVNSKKSVLKYSLDVFNKNLAKIYD